MTQEEIKECNKLIAEFMELPMHDTLSIAKTPLNAYEWNCNLYSLSELHYHDNWEWLMPVVEKIEKDHNCIIIDGTSCHIDSNDGQYSEMNCCTMNNRFETDKETESKIESTWLAVVEFINWYNKNKK